MRTHWNTLTENGKFVCEYMKYTKEMESNIKNKNEDDTNPQNNS